MEEKIAQDFDKSFVLLLIDKMRRGEVTAKIGKSLAKEYLDIPKLDEKSFVEGCMRIGERYPMMYSVIERNFRNREDVQEEKLEQASRLMRGGDFEGAIAVLKHE